MCLSSGQNADRTVGMFPQGEIKRILNRAKRLVTEDFAIRVRKPPRNYQDMGFFTRPGIADG